MTDHDQRAVDACPSCGADMDEPYERAVCPACGADNTDAPDSIRSHAPGCTTAPHDGECAPELDRLSDPHDCEPTDDGTACRICGLPAERDVITPAELMALIAALPPEPEHWENCNCGAHRRDA